MITIWTTNATVTLMRAPSRSRLNMSRPSWSVPRRWPGENGGTGRLPLAKTALRSCCWYGYGASNGPNKPKNRRRRTRISPTIARRLRLRRPNASRHGPELALGRATTRPSTAVVLVAIFTRLLAVPDPRVDVGVEHVD